MSLHIHQLKGCRPQPLAHYFKALAVLRLVGEQADGSARGFWKDDVFHLVTTLDRGALEAFFLETYAPTPIVGPWNNGSGFSEGENTEGRDAILASPSPRFAAFKATIEAVLAWPELPATGLSVAVLCQRVAAVAHEKTGKARTELLGVVSAVEFALAGADVDERRDVLACKLDELDVRAQGKSTLAKRARAVSKAAKKVRTKSKGEARSEVKTELAPAVRRRLSSDALRWLDTALVITRDGALAFPPVAGSGGNDGNLEYTRGFMQALKMVAIEPSTHARDWFATALWAERSASLQGPTTGQFHPGRAGGPNQGHGFLGSEISNPWDVVLNLEGLLTWASSTSKIGAPEGATGFSSPFTVRAAAVGYASAVRGDQESARGEVWVPLWGRPVGYRELTSFVAEGRAQVGRRRTAGGAALRPVRSAIDFAEAAGSLGVARGIAEFVRYGLVKRRGKSFVALPAGRFHVRRHSSADLVRGLAPLLAEVDRFLRSFGDMGPPARLSSARRAVEAALFDALAQPSRPRLLAVLTALGGLERLLALRDRSKAPSLRRPLGGLDPRWVVDADDGGAEIRIATALASIRATGRVGPLRANLVSIDPEKPWTWVSGHGQVRWSGATLSQRLAAALGQRMMDAGRLGARSNPTDGIVRLAPEDLALFVEGAVDDDRIEDLLFGLGLVDWSRHEDSETVAVLNDRWATPIRRTPLAASWAVLKLVFWPRPLETSAGERVTVAPEPSIVPVLRAGRVDEACRVARRRLFVSGLAPVDVTWPVQTGSDSTRVAASLLIPCRAEARLTRAVLAPRR